VADTGARVERVSSGALRVAGEIDMSNADSIAAMLTRAALDGANSHITLDLSDLSFIDSSGIQMLIGVARANPGLSLVLSPLSPEVARVLAISGLPREGDGFRVGPLDRAVDQGAGASG
jgi:anti-anti-sigma factor